MPTSSSFPCSSRGTGSETPRLFARGIWTSSGRSSGPGPERSSYGNPHLIRKLDEVPGFAVGYGEGGWFGNQAVYFDTFVAWLKGGIEPSGRLPVRVSDRYPIGAGL
jgi:hypothetical protein